MTIPEFCDWLSNTSVSQAIQNHTWVIPSVQSVHILSIATVMASIVMVNFRLLGGNARGPTIPQVAHRFLPWVWCAVCVLAATGIILIIGEPARELESEVFWTKMTLLACVLVLTGAVQFGAFRRERFWENRRVLASILAVVSLCLWVGIVAAGRWIAYMGHG